MATVPTSRQRKVAFWLCFLSLCLATCRPAHAQSSQEQQIEQQVYALTNQFPAQHGLQQLRLDGRLIACARAHSAEMIRMGYFSHRSPTPGYVTVADRGRAAGIGDLACGENLASLRGYAPSQLPQAAMTGWINSPGHLANLMRPTYDHVGIGVVISGSQCMITSNFGEPLLIQGPGGSWSPASVQQTQPQPTQPTSVYHATPRPAALGTRQIDEQLVALINQARRDAGLEPLRVDDRLRQAAVDHDAEMLALNYFSHTSPSDGQTTVADRVHFHGVTDMDVTRTIAQMRGYASSTLAQAAVTNFLGSEPQRNILLHPAYTTIGAGVVVGQGKAMVCVVFGGPAGSGATLPNRGHRLGQASRAGQPVAVLWRQIHELVWRRLGRSISKGFVT